MTTKKPVRSTRLYEIAPKANVEDLKGQAKVIVMALRANQPATMAQIADRAAKKLETEQEPIRVVNHYLGKFKAAKIVREVKKRAA